MNVLLRPNSSRTVGAASDCIPSKGGQADPLDRLFLLLKQQQEAKEVACNQEVERIAAMIGDNGGLPLVEPFGIDAPWFQFADADQIERLAKLHVRIERRRLIMADDLKERKVIRSCCIKRMRRAAGKD
jgi:hypothetical protein